MDYTLMGTLEILPMGIYVSYNYMANILSLKEAADYLRMNTDTKEYHTMLFHYIKDKYYRFNGCGKSLYYLNVSNPEITPPTPESGNTNYCFLSTVNAKME